jgi:hypothetical protein
MSSGERPLFQSSLLGLVLALGRFLFVNGRFVSVVQPAIRTCAGTVPDDLFMSEEERAHPIYLTGSVQLTQGRAGRAPFPILFLKSFFFLFSFLGSAQL